MRSQRGGGKRQCLLTHSYDPFVRSDRIVAEQVTEVISHNT